jgi:hypothetical protein
MADKRHLEQREQEALLCVLTMLLASGAEPSVLDGLNLDTSSLPGSIAFVDTNVVEQTNKGAFLPLVVCHFLRHKGWTLVVPPAVQKELDTHDQDIPPLFNTLSSNNLYC